MTRKLPVYILVDTSGSMSGEPIEAVNNGSKLLIRALRKDPQALETVKISFIEFNSNANVVMPMTDIPQVQEPSFAAGGGTSLGKAIDLLSDCISQDVKIGDTKTEQKGDYKPLVFLFTDGIPTDGWRAAMSRFNRKSVNFIASFYVKQFESGKNDLAKAVLEEISGPEFVVMLESVTEDELSKFFQWVTQSIEVASVSIPNSANEDMSPNSLPTMPNQEQEVLL